jgi:hypothetical protein
MALSWTRHDFPNLLDGMFVKTSCRDGQYNCIAWAANDTRHWWEPTEHRDGVKLFWPPAAPWDCTVDAYVAAFAWYGYAPCDMDGSLESGWEKIALYGRLEGGRMEAQHAARQLRDGRWTSKLGSEEDIDHLSVRNLYRSAAGYGEVVLYLKRRRALSVSRILRILRTRLFGTLETKRRIRRLDY